MTGAAHEVVSRFAVRSYETDSYRHLNNGVYVNWLEHGRQEYFMSLGFSYDSLGDREQWVVVARAEIDFRAALHDGDAVDVHSSIERFGRTSCRFRQVMRFAPGHARAGEVACEGVTVMVFTDGGGPIPVPDDVRQAAADGRPAG